MSTTLAKPAEMADRKWYVIDAAGKPLGRVAAKAAVLLRGKNKPTFTPNVDCGDHVIIINCDQAVLTGKKLEKKFHRTHSGWIGGLKETQYKTLMAEASDKAMTYAVKGMVPRQHPGRQGDDPPALLQDRRTRPCRAETERSSSKEATEYVRDERIFLRHRPS